jgi:DNA-binding MarR family transcriptional regulator
MKVNFTPEERAAAHRALRDLEADGLVAPTLADVVAPFDWLELTEAGRRAVERHAPDELDQWLQEIDPTLVDMRDGAMAAVHSAQPDAIRQAAHSGRELIRQVLDRLAPDDQVERTSWFRGEKVTRRDRVKLTLERRAGRISASTLQVVEAQCDVVEANYRRLSAMAHDETAGQAARDHVVELLRASEAALKDLLRR